MFVTYTCLVKEKLLKFLNNILVKDCLKPACKIQHECRLWHVNQPLYPSGTLYQAHVLLYGQFLWPIKEVPHAPFECMKFEKSCNKDTTLKEYIWSFCTPENINTTSQPKSGKNRQLVADEPVEFKK